MSVNSTVLRAKDIARIRGWSLRSAQRWLAMLPPDATTRIGPNGRILGITQAQLDAQARGAPSPLDTRVEARLSDLEERVAELEGRADNAARRLSVARL